MGASRKPGRLARLGLNRCAVRAAQVHRRCLSRGTRRSGRRAGSLCLCRDALAGRRLPGRCVAPSARGARRSRRACITRCLLLGLPSGSFDCGDDSLLQFSLSPAFGQAQVSEHAAKLSHLHGADLLLGGQVRLWRRLGRRCAAGALRRWPSRGSLGVLQSDCLGGSHGLLRWALGGACARLGGALLLPIALLHVLVHQAPARQGGQNRREMTWQGARCGRSGRAAPRREN